VFEARQPASSGASRRQRSVGRGRCSVASRTVHWSSALHDTSGGAAVWPGCPASRPPSQAARASDSRQSRGPHRVVVLPLREHGRCCAIRKTMSVRARCAGSRSPGRDGRRALRPWPSRGASAFWRSKARSSASGATASRSLASSASAKRIARAQELPRNPLISAERSGNCFVCGPDDTGMAQEGPKGGRALEDLRMVRRRRSVRSSRCIDISAQAHGTCVTRPVFAPSWRNEAHA
jgi:hypothetical protein